MEEEVQSNEVPISVESKNIDDLFGSDLDDDSEADEEKNDEIQKNSVESSQPVMATSSAVVPTQSLDDDGIPTYHWPKFPQLSPFYKVFRLPSSVAWVIKPFDKETWDPRKEAKLYPNARFFIRWRYERDEDGNLLRDEKGDPKTNGNSTWLHDGKTGKIVGLLIAGEHMIPIDSTPTHHKFLLEK